MKIAWFVLGVFLFSISSVYSQGQKKEQLFWGEKLPGNRVVLFAPDQFNHPEGYHSSLIFTLDLKEAYFSPMSHYGEIHKISNTKKDCLIQEITFPALYDSGDPFLSPDNKRLYFLSFQPTGPDSVYRERIWYAEVKDGKLYEPQVVDKAVTDHPTHWQFSVASNYNLYFTSEITSEANQDIYLSQYLDGKYTEPIKLPDEINSAHKELCPFISPDENYLIFSRSGPGTEKTDLFISYKEGNAWLVAEELPGNINSGGHELCPVVTPDGNHLFFISTRAGNSKIYWVSTTFL